MGVESMTYSVPHVPVEYGGILMASKDIQLGSNVAQACNTTRLSDVNDVNNVMNVNMILKWGGDCLKWIRQRIVFKSDLLRTNF